MKKKDKRGGKRKGAGRKPTGAEPTKLRRIPLSLLDHIDLLIYQRRHDGKTTTIHPMP